MINSSFKNSLEFVLAELGESSIGTQTIVNMRQVSSTLKQLVDQIVESSQIFRSSFKHRPIDERCFKQQTALSRLNDLFFGN